MFKKKGFLLIELMVAVSVLAIGIVFILRSFLNSSSALATLSNKIAAITMLENTISDIEINSKEKNGTKKTEKQEELDFGVRKAVLATQIKELNIDELATGLNEVKLSLSWYEDSRPKDEKLVTYLPKKE
ncbi:MAG: type II secretion system protein [Candidatus Omnitrophota bacterium]|jgi:prepilin-type N-terminal cleavage/methylation domain-containing protein